MPSTVGKWCTWAKCTFGNQATQRRVRARKCFWVLEREQVRNFAKRLGRRFLISQDARTPPASPGRARRPHALLLSGAAHHVRGKTRRCVCLGPGGGAGAHRQWSQGHTRQVHGNPWISSWASHSRKQACLWLLVACPSPWRANDVNARIDQEQDQARYKQQSWPASASTASHGKDQEILPSNPRPSNQSSLTRLACITYAYAKPSTTYTHCIHSQAQCQDCWELAR
jgi:hypothetical protein